MAIRSIYKRRSLYETFMAVRPSNVADVNRLVAQVKRAGGAAALHTLAREATKATLDEHDIDPRQIEPYADGDGAAERQEARRRLPVRRVRQTGGGEGVG